MGARNDRIRELYEAALKRPIGERATFVSSHSQGDDDLRLRVVALLTGQEDTQLPGYEPGAEGSPLLASGTEIGQYRIDGPLGAGGMGVVYRATDTKLNRPAAIKVLPESLADPEARRRFQREAQMASSLNHPHIVTVYDAGEYQERQYLITEYVDGGTLRQWAARPRGWRSIVELLVGVADAVAVAHEAGILHRDIKPENILLAKNGYAKLADFGLAKLLEADPLADDAFAGVRPDPHSSLIGTAAYMSPEQAQGLPLDGRSDVYSFGLVLHELLSGQRPDAARALEQRHGRTAAPLPPLGDGLPAELRSLVVKALEHDPVDRYQTMRELVVDLRRIVRRSGIEDEAAVDALAANAAAARARKRRNTLVLAAIAVMAIGASAFYSFRAPPVNAIAVLPFLNESGDSDDLHISEGLGDDLRQRLMGLPGFKIQARGSSVSVRDLGLDTRAVANRLGVSVVVNGFLRRRGNMLSVIVEAADTEGQLLQTWTRESPEQELLVLQNAIAADVTAFLAPDLAATAPATAPTSASETAHALVLRGMLDAQDVYDNLSVDDAKLRRAIDYFRRAVAIDPTSIEAHSRLAQGLVYRGDVGDANEALATAHNLSTSDAVTTPAELSNLYPSNADALGAYAQWLMTHDYFAAAEPYFELALDIDRERLSRYVDFAEYHAIEEDMDAARALGEQIRLRFPDARGHRALARLYETTGEIDVGIAYALEAYRAEPTDPETTAQVAELFARIGLFDKADEFEPNPEAGLLNQLYFRRDYRRLVEEASELMLEYPDDVKIRYMLAFAMNAIGDSGNAIRILEGAGIPIQPHSEFMTGAADEANTTYVDALQAVGGRDDLARELAMGKLTTRDPALFRSWWVASYWSCTLAQVGRLEEALELLETVKRTQGLALSPFIADALCFRAFQDEPRYRWVLEHLEARQAELRARLPATLQRFGVADVRPYPAGGSRTR
jgi:TolB-like protein